MPRRNHVPRRRRPQRTTVLKPPQPTPGQLAESLVERRLASPIILGPRRSSWRFRGGCG